MNEPTRRRPRYRLHSLVTLVLLLALAALLAWLSLRYPLQADWTRSGRHTLSAASLAVLKQVEGELEVSAYARDQGELRRVIREFIDRYRRVKPDIRLHFVNPDAVPNEVRRLGIQVNGELVLRYRGRSEHVRSASEREFTHAVQRLIRGGERWLAFLSGHGERDPLGRANHDLGQWGTQLRARGFQIQSLNLGEAGAVPDNTAVLIIASPLVTLLPGEVDRIRAYLERGGNLLWLRDPGENGGLEPLADWLGLRFDRGTVLDPGGRLIGIDDPTISVITPPQYGKHPLLQGFAFTTLFPGAVSLRQAGGDWQATTLLRSGDDTWLETGPLQGRADFDPDSDRRGPLSLGLALERERDGDNRSHRVAVIGDGDFLSNTYIANAGNLELGMRLINWLSLDDELIHVPVHTVEDTRLELSPMVAGAAGLFFLIILPLLLLAAGAVIAWRRRKR